MKILLVEFNTEVERENILEMTIGNGSLLQDSIDNGVKIVTLATSKNLFLKSMMFLHQNITKCTWTSPDGKTHKQTAHKLIDRRWNFRTFDV